MVTGEVIEQNAGETEAMTSRRKMIWKAGGCVMGEKIQNGEIVNRGPT